MLIHCVKHLTWTPFLLHQSEENFARLFFVSVLHFEKLMETGSLYLGPLHSSDVVQLQGKFFIMPKMSLVFNVFINSLWLNILDRIVLVNVYTVEICSILLNCVGKFFFTLLSFFILLMFLMFIPLFTK